MTEPRISLKEWQPIETAPKDWGRFIAWDGDHFVGFWDAWLEPEAEGLWRDAMYTDRYPTYWMPLPAPPKEQP